MKQLLILSGKGGTGKTTLASAFIQMAQARAYADCDVDAPNLHLVTEQNAPCQTTDFYGMDKAVIDPSRCVKCGKCLANCRFDAIAAENAYRVDAYACEGCGVCAAVCPVDAISMQPAVAGDLMRYADESSVFSTAQLRMGSGNSGLLVTEVKKQMREGVAADTPFAIIDGSPGIGCPVIASLSGVDLVLLVTEPSLSGISDMERILKTAQTFGTKAAICINKYDIHAENTAKIEAFCQLHHLPLVGKIPFDPLAVQAVNQGKTIAAIDCAAGRAAKAVYAQTIQLLLPDEERADT